MTDSFDRAALAFLEEVGEGSAAARSLFEYLKKLHEYEWDGTLPLESVGWDGNTLAVRFHPGFRLTFRRWTERVSAKPVCVHLYLKNIERTA